MKATLHIGTKLIIAIAMTRIQYNDYRGWELPEDEKHLANEEGFLVEYVNGGKSNHSKHKAYISWSPKDVFNESYKASGEMSFGMAIEAARQGYKIARTGWNCSGMFAYIEKHEYKYTTVWNPDKSFKNYPLREAWMLKTAQDDISAWAPSGSDSLANDWCIID